MNNKEFPYDPSSEGNNDKSIIVHSVDVHVSRTVREGPLYVTLIESPRSVCGQWVESWV